MQHLFCKEDYGDKNVRKYYLSKIAEICRMLDLLSKKITQPFNGSALYLYRVQSITVRL